MCEDSRERRRLSPRSRFPAAILLAELLAGACTSPATQLVVVVDTDYLVPGELGFIRAVIRDDAGRESDSLERTLVASDPVSGEATIPHSFAVVPKDGDHTRRIIVEVQGFGARDGSPRVVRRAATGFIEKKSLVLSMFLAKSCDGVWVTCASGETCTENGCESESRPPESLLGVEPGRELPVRRDAGAGDSVVVPDSGVDVSDASSAEDAGGVRTDAEPTPVDCGVDLGPPASIMTLSVPHDVDKHMLIGDVDGDGDDEIVASRGGAGTSAFSVIDFEGCAMPVVTSTTVLELKQEPVLVESRGETRLWVGERRGLRVWRYLRGSSPPLAQIRNLLVTDDLAHVSVAPDLGRAVATVRTTAWGFAAIDVASGQVSVDTRSERIRSVLAFVSSPDLFVGGGDGTIQLIRGGAQAISVAPVAMAKDPVVVREEDDRAIVLARLDRTLHTLSLNLEMGTVTSTSTSVTLPAAINSEPVPANIADDVRVYLLLTNGTVTWCDLADREGVSAAACRIADSAETFSIPEDDVDSDGGLLTAYVNADDVPDVVLVTRRGVVHFLDGAGIRNPAAPSVALGRDAKRVGALAPGFWDRYGVPGDLLVVQHTGGMISLIGWRRPSGAGSSSRLWTQHHRDPQRSGLSP